jgi:hypothetical protein
MAGVARTGRVHRLFFFARGFCCLVLDATRIFRFAAAFAADFPLKVSEDS